MAESVALVALANSYWSMVAAGRDEATSVEGIVGRCEAGEISPAVALMELLIATEDADAVARVLRSVRHRSVPAAAVQALFNTHEEGCRKIASMLSADVDTPPAAGPGTSVEEGVAFSRRLFDWSVQQSEAASVALYSLGSPGLLAEATAEIVALLASWDLLDRDRVVLDVGCGTGRMETALAPAVAHIHGLDVSPQMVAVAQGRCGHLGNVTIALSSGLDLGSVATTSCDLVLAVDSFPYVVQAGLELAAVMFAEAARVLRPGGEFVIFNFSYRGDRGRDRADVRLFAARNGFDLLVDGDLPFRLWNGDAYRMRKLPSEGPGARGGAVHSVP